VLIRTEGRPETYQRALREAFWSVDSNQPLWEVASLESRLAAFSTNERFLSALLGGFAGLALLLAAVGMYGVMAHGVGRRRHELGVRMALGAGRGRVLMMVLRQGVVLTVLGAAVGLVAAAAVARALASVVYGVGVFDPLTFTVAPLVLIAVAVLATYIPARRATRVDPVDAFRG
jgi:ABC-type antimicrobial peptide transport system permease subunit